MNIILPWGTPYPLIPYKGYMLNMYYKQMMW